MSFLTLSLVVADDEYWDDLDVDAAKEKEEEKDEEEDEEEGGKKEEEEEEEEDEKGEEEIGFEGDTLIKTTGTFLFGQSNPKGSGRSAGPTRDRTSPP